MTSLDLAKVLTANFQADRKTIATVPVQRMCCARVHVIQHFVGFIVLLFIHLHENSSIERCLKILSKPTI